MMKTVNIKYKTSRKEQRKYEKIVKGNFDNFSHRELVALAKARHIKIEKQIGKDKIKLSKGELKNALAGIL